MSATEMSSSEGWLGSQRQAEKLRHSGGDQIKAATPRHKKEPAEIVWTSGPGCLLGQKFWVSVWRPQNHGELNLIVKVSCLNRKECWHGETNSGYGLRLNVFFKQPQLFCPSEVLLKIEELYRLAPSLCFLFFFM